MTNCVLSPFFCPCCCSLTSAIATLQLALTSHSAPGWLLPQILLKTLGSQMQVEANVKTDEAMLWSVLAFRYSKVRTAKDDGITLDNDL